MAADDISFWRELGLEKCVFCQSTKAGRKVLFCLHLSCATCLSEHLSADNTVCCTRCQLDTPDPGPGRKLLDCLADWPGTISSDEVQASPVQGPVEETPAKLLCQDPDCDDYAAIGKCTSCDLLLCDVHSAAHKRNKGTRDHTVEQFPGKDVEKGSGVAVDCPLHTGENLTGFCNWCEELLCRICFPKHSDHEVFHVNEAAEKCKRMLAKEADKENSDGKPRVRANVHREDRISEHLDAIDAEATAMSEAITKDVQECYQSLSQLETQSKACVDRVRWSIAKPLEKVKQDYQERRGRLVAAKLLIDNLHPISLLRASKAIGECLMEGDRETTKEVKGQAAVLGIKLNPLCQMLKEDVGLHRHLSWKEQERLQAPKTSIAYCNLFDPLRKSVGITLSHRNQMATAGKKLEQVPGSKNNGNCNWHAVLGVGNFKQGCHVAFSIQLLEKAAFTFIGMSSPSPLSIDMDQHFQGWTGMEANCEFTRGGRLGVPWMDDDVITLRMDFINRRLAATHERTGASETRPILNPEEDHCLKIFLPSEGSVRLLVP